MEPTRRLRAIGVAMGGAATLLWFSSALQATPCPRVDYGPSGVDDDRPLGHPSAVHAASIMSPALSGDEGFFALDGELPVVPPEAGRGPLTFELRGRGAALAGENLDLKLTVRNDGWSTHGVVRPLDGSLQRWRAPIYDVFVEDLQTGETYLYAYVGSRCGNMNRLHDKDIVHVRPGETRGGLADGWGRQLQNAAIHRPGRYRVWVAYAFCNYRSLSAWWTHIGARIWTGSTSSNAIEVTVHQPMPL